MDLFSAWDVPLSPHTSVFSAGRPLSLPAVSISFSFSLFSFLISSGGLPCFSSLPVCFALLFLLQLFTVGQRFAAASAMMLPAGRAVTVSGAVYTPAGAETLRHLFHHRFSGTAAPAQARPIPRMGTADCASRLPRQDSTTTATPIARVSALKIIEMISRNGKPSCSTIRKRPDYPVYPLRFFSASGLFEIIIPTV